MTSDVALFSSAVWISCSLIILSHLGLGQLLLLELGQVLLLAAPEELLLDRREPVRDLLVGDRDPLRGCALLLLRLLNEEIDHLAPDGLVLGRSLLRKRVAVRYERPLRLDHQRGELRLRDVLVADHGNVAARQR